MATTTTHTDSKYFEGVGKRKSAIARVRISESAKNSFEINDRAPENYFPGDGLGAVIRLPLSASGSEKKYKISVHVRGGGISAQAQAVSLGLARALVLAESATRAPIKKAGLLTRNSRIKERRKFGLKKARKAPQWSKR